MSNRTQGWSCLCKQIRTLMHGFGEGGERRESATLKRGKNVIPNFVIGILFSERMAREPILCGAPSTGCGVQTSSSMLAKAQSHTRHSSTGLFAAHRAGLCCAGWTPSTHTACHLLVSPQLLDQCVHDSNNFRSLIDRLDHKPVWFQYKISMCSYSCIQREMRQLLY